VGGSGTPADPYIIEGWEMDVQDGGASGVKIMYTTAHFVVRNCYVIGEYAAVAPGIMLIEVVNGRIENNVVLDTWAGVGLYRSHSISAIGNMAQGNRHGIKLDHSYDITVASNNVSSNGWGIGILFSYDNRILGNEIYDNGLGLEILYEGSEGNVVAHNNFTQNIDHAVDGTLLNSWDDGYPSGGNCWDDYGGVDGYSGPNQDLPGMDGIGDYPYIIDQDLEDRYPLHNPAWGCGIVWSPTGLTRHDPIHILDETDFTPENGVTGGKGTSSDPYIIDGWDINASEADGIYISCWGVAFVIRNVLVHDGGGLFVGIRLQYSDYGRLENVTLTRNKYGVYSNQAIAGIIRSRIFSNTVGGVWAHAGGVWAEDSSITSNGGTGFYSHDTAFTSAVVNSNVSSNEGTGISISWGSESHIENNTISNNGLHGVVMDGYSPSMASGNVIFQNGERGLHITMGSQYFKVENNTISHHKVGIMNEGRRNTFANNTLEFNNFGLCVGNSDDNLIYDNVLKSNGIGLRVVWSDPNIIYHNAFLNNTIQAEDNTGTNLWDNGYPIGGNFWSDYLGVDNCSGPNQDICPDPDGIGDVPYVIDIGIEDRYPLMYINGSRDVKPPIPEGRVNGPRMMGNITINRMRSIGGEGGIYTVKWLETLRSQFNDIQDLRYRPELLKCDEIEKLEISRAQNKFQCPNVLSVKRN
jgi:parallel beta-helix repeat protein